jgi:pyruvate,water dikinase
VVAIGTGVDVDGVPPGAVLVAHAPSPHYAPLLAHASAIVTTVGSPTGHLATMAREYRVPMVVATGDAARVLQPGMDVTVDAEENVIYEGLVHELVHYHLSRRRTDADFEEFRALRRLLRRIAPLNLTDPAAESFRARNCRTCHDVVRFAHEMAVRELMEMPGLTAQDRRRFLRRVKLPIPLDLDALDLGGGITDAPGGPVPVEAITSAPLAALLGPLCASWRTEPVRLDMQSFLASATRSMSVAAPETSQVRPNLAVVTHDYLNLHLHLGYHYNMVDCRVTDTPEDNYAYFRFHGGVTELTRRSRRVRTIAAIMQEYGFGVETRGDMVVGRLRGTSREMMRERIEMIGRLIGYTRQLDVLMRHEGSVQEFTRNFCSGAAPQDATASAVGKPAAGASPTAEATSTPAG